MATMRRAEAADAVFLRRLFDESQRDLLEALGPAAEALIQMQYRGRQQTYAAQFPQAEDWILLGEADEPVGRMLVDRSGAVWRLVDIAFRREVCGQGRGSQCLRSLQHEAAEAGASIHLSVAPGNPAERLYRRLGFEPVRQTPAALEMEWTAR